MKACDAAYDTMISDWEKARANGIPIQRCNWVAAIERFAKRTDLFISTSSNTKLVLVVSDKMSGTMNHAEVLKDVWLQRKRTTLKGQHTKGNEGDGRGCCSVASVFSTLYQMGAWDLVSLFLWQAPLPQREMSVHRLAFTESISKAQLVCDQTTHWLQTGRLSVELRELTENDGKRFIDAHRQLRRGSEVRMRPHGSSKHATRSSFRVVSLAPLVMAHEERAEMAPGLITSNADTLSLRGPSVVVHSDIAALTRVSREIAFLTRSSIKSQQRGRLLADERVHPTLPVSCAMLKRISRTSMRCNYGDVHKLQETYHFTPKNIGVLSTTLCPTGNSNSSSCGGFYYAGCGLGREVLAMSISNPRQLFIANDLPGEGPGGAHAAIDQASALRSRAVGFGLVVADQISVSAASMCSAFSATKQVATSVLYSTVTSLDILRDTLRRALFGGVTMVCMLTHVARPNSTVAGSTFDAAVTASVAFALGPHGIRDIRKTISTNIPGGGVVVYDFTRVPACMMRLVVSGILAQAW
jgi:hypothetical protein